jgi:phenylalanine-4-hydroxylase
LAPENPKIYGAGLLSSIGESVSPSGGEEDPYYGANCAFSIYKQPAFVCRDFQHLKDVPEEFASKMAYQVGGLKALTRPSNATMLRLESIRPGCR